MSGLAWYPLYCERFHMATSSWSNEEVGAYVRLLNYQWMNGSLPLGFDRLERIAPGVEQVWDIVGAKFVVDPEEGVQRNRRLHEIYEEQKEKAERLSERGRRAVAAREAARSSTRSSTRSSQDDLAMNHPEPERDRDQDQEEEEEKTMEKTPSDADAPDEGPPPKLNAQAQRVDALVQIHPAAGEKMNGKGAPWGAAWLKKWSDAGLSDNVLQAALEECAETYPDHPAKYINQVLNTALKRGGEIAKPKQRQVGKDRRIGQGTGEDVESRREAFRRLSG